MGLGHKRDYSHVAGEASYSPAPSGASLDPPVVGARAIVESDLTRDDLVRLPRAVEALGQRAYESWNVGSIIETLAHWYLVRTAELRETKGDIRGALSEAKVATDRADRAASTVEDFRTSLREVRAERDHYRQSHDTLWRSHGYGNSRHGHDSLVGSSATNVRAPLPSIPDPYSPAPRDGYAPTYRAPTRDIEGGPPRVASEDEDAYYRDRTAGHYARR